MDVHKPQKYFGVITKKIQLTQTVFHFFIQHIQPQDMLFTPGQYATVIINPHTRRQYSFCSIPNNAFFELVIDIAPMGQGSKYFLEKKEGDSVEYLAPLGNFTMNYTPLKKVLVATGTGTAPFRSMILHHFQNTSVDASEKPADITLYWGLRYEDDIYWHTEFQTFVRQYTGFQYFLCLSKSTPGWSGLKGHVTELVIDNEKNMENSEFYLCGNTAMITEVKSILSDRKVEEKRIKTDLFY